MKILLTVIFPDNFNFSYSTLLKHSNQNFSKFLKNFKSFSKIKKKLQKKILQEFYFHFHKVVLFDKYEIQNTSNCPMKQAKTKSQFTFASIQNICSRIEGTDSSEMNTVSYRHQIATARVPGVFSLVFTLVLVPRTPGAGHQGHPLRLLPSLPVS